MARHNAAALATQVTVRHDFATAAVIAASTPAAHRVGGAIEHRDHLT